MRSEPLALTWQAMEKSLEGYRDRDLRYSFRAPEGALRAGPSLGWTVLGYDLCYDGWDEGFRKQVAEAIANYNEGQWCSLAELARGERQHPGSNHWGMQVGGAALALLAVMNDPGMDMTKLGPLLKVSQTSMIINMTQGFGDGGFFAEGDGTGSMASFISFLPALQAWRVAAGKDFYTPKPHAQWMLQKWFFLTALGAAPDKLRASFPERGGYPQNIWARTGLSGGNYFGTGFGLATEQQQAALLWFYNHAGLKAADDEYKGNKAAASWLPNRSLAQIWRAFESKNPPVKIEASTADGKLRLPADKKREMVVKVGTRVKLEAVTTASASLKKVQFYAGDQLLGEASQGPWKMDWKPSTSGPSAVFVQWESEPGQWSVSNPALIVVKKAALP